MISAVFLDMDETLCGTLEASERAALKIGSLVSGESGIGAELFATGYIEGLFNKPLKYKGMNEVDYRTRLIQKITTTHYNKNLSEIEARSFQDQFEVIRMDTLDFFPTVEEQLRSLRDRFTLVVITNGPTYSQRAKIKALNLEDYVDYIIVGGEEPEQKPFSSIFKKALDFVDCDPSEVVHIGDSLMADIAGANGVDIKSIWLSSDTKENRHLLLSSDAHIPSMMISSYRKIEETVLELSKL